MPTANHIRKIVSKGFTLIELLVVVGILGALTILALVTLNPAEAQRKSRDVQRLKDMATIQSIVEQALSDNPGTGITFSASDSSSATASSCSNGWLSAAILKGGTSLDLCTYANVIPVDPVNRATTVTSSTAAELASTNAYYYIRWSGSNYKVCTYLESKANAAKLKGDGEATENNVFSIYSGSTIACPV